MEDEAVDQAVDEPVGQHERWRPNAADILCLGGIAAAIIRAYVTLLFVAELLGTNPVLLELLRGSSSSMVAAGAFARDGQASLPLAILAGLVGLAFFDAFYWWGGRRYGNRILAFYTERNPRYARWVDRSERVIARWGGLVLVVQYFQPIPSVLFYIGTGASGMPLWYFLVCDLIGTLLWVGLMVGMGYAIGHPAVQIAKTISHDALLATIALIVLVFVVAFIRALRTERRQSEPTG
jgi:membrane protein DedA with SNARE-associated domain